MSKSTTRAMTTIFRPTTKTSPAIVFNKTSSCPSEYFGLLNELSCDFTRDFCNYTTINSPIHWQSKKGAGGSWIARIPERKNTLSGTFTIIICKDIDTSFNVTILPPNFIITILGELMKS